MGHQECHKAQRPDSSYCNGGEGSSNVLASTLGRCWYAMPKYPGLGYDTIGARSIRVLITAELRTAGNATDTSAITNARTGSGTTAAAVVVPGAPTALAAAAAGSAATRTP